MSTVAIVVNSIDITSSVLFNTATFEQTFGGVPGSFQFTVRDPNRTLSFQTGKEMYLTVDGIRMFGGYVTQVSMSHMAPAADASNVSTYQLRTWILRGTDYNVIFDKRVARNTANYLTQITLTGTTDGAILRDLVDNFSDCSDFTTTGIQNIVTMPTPGDVIAQGTKLRDEFNVLSFFGSAAWYVDGSKNFIYVPYEDVEKRWGFSDDPNNAAITASPASYQGSTRGFRQVEAQEDGTYLVNDALVWGGSPFTGSSGGTVFSRTEDATSESTYGRWQWPETHFGESKFASQTQVNLRSAAIVNGLAGTTVYGQQKGLKNTQWQFTFTWFSVDVPLLSGVPDHLVAGDIVTIEMSVFGVTKLLPLRSLRTSFPDAFDATGARVVQFEGTFGLQLSDPYTLWQFVNSAKSNASLGGTSSATAAAAANDTSTSTVYGSIGQFTPTPITDGATTLFSLAFGYVSGTLDVYIVYAGSGGGVLLRTGIDYTETDNVAGTFTMATAPLGTSQLIVRCLTLGGTSSTGSFYISPTGSDSTGTGLIDAPWASIQKWVNTNPAPGSTLYLRDGDYSESAGFSNARDTYGNLIGTASQPITIRNYPGETPSFPGVANTVFSIGPNEVSNTIGANYLVIDGIRFPDATISDEATIRLGGFTTGVSANSYLVQNVTIRNCYFSLTSGAASIDHCVGVVRGVQGTIIEDCVFDGVNGGQGDGFVIYDEPAALDTVVQRCIFNDWDRLGIQVWDYNTSSPTATIQIKHCSFIDITDNGIDLRYHSTTLVQNCAFTTPAGTSSIYDPNNSGDTTLDNNFYDQVFDSGNLLVAGQTGRGAATDGLDAGALDW